MAETVLNNNNIKQSKIVTRIVITIKKINILLVLDLMNLVNLIFSQLVKSF